MSYLLDFIRSEMRQEFELALHPILREMSLRFARYCPQNQLPIPTVTAISRQLKFYDDNGLPTVPTSWHLVDAAIDYRIRHYTNEQLKKVISWWEAELNWAEELKKLPAQRHFEFITKMHGTGPHLHIAIRDAAWRRQKQAENK